MSGNASISNVQKIQPIQGIFELMDIVKPLQFIYLFFFSLEVLRKETCFKKEEENKELTLSLL